MGLQYLGANFLTFMYVLPINGHAHQISDPPLIITLYFRVVVHILLV